LIFVSVGSQKFQFNRLLKYLDELVKCNKVNEKIVAQTGHSTYVPQNYEYSTFLNKSEYNKLIENCNLLITHGGTGNIINGLKRKKKVIAIPRLKEFNEHVDNHQNDIINEFSKMDLILTTSNINELEALIEKARNNNTESYKSNTDNFIELLDNYISRG
jgi:UDP-N-acetylglucosamine transferase subunit ALG13